MVGDALKKYSAEGQLRMHMNARTVNAFLMVDYCLMCCEE